LTKHITILALGSRGDVQPYVALAKGLKRASYQVRLAAPANYALLAAQHGLDFFPIAPDSQQVMAGETGRKMMTIGDDPSAFIHLLAQMVSAYARNCLLASLSACQDTDTIVFNSFGLMGYHIAEKLDIPVFGAWIYPLNRTCAYPSMGAPSWLPSTALTNWLSYLVDEQMVQHAFHHIFAKWRQMLELPPMPITGFYDYLYRRRIPQVYAYSASVVPRPYDWPDRFAITGYWFLDHEADWQPSAALQGFLDAGPPPVYIGFGSVVGNASAKLGTVAIDALRRSGQRGILATGWGGIAAPKVNDYVTDDIFVVDSVPHDWLFSRMAGVIHHGGAGTTAAGLRAGIPSAIVPFSGDQPFWGRRVEALGVGPRPISHSKLTVNRLSAAIHTLATDNALQERARALGQQIRAEDGVGCAVDTFEKMLQAL